MSLGPDPIETLARARADLRMGVPVAITGAGDIMLVAAVEALSPARWKQMRNAQAHLVITARRAETLKARVYDGDLCRIAVPQDAALSWAQALADPASDLLNPMKGPFAALREGDASAHRAGIALAKSARLLPALVAMPTGTLPQGVTTVAQSDVLSPDAIPFQRSISARVPLALAQNARLHVFRPEDGGEEHYAIEVGTPARDAPVLSRLHSACFTGDLLGSLKCDCGPQLHAALAQMGQEGAGVLLYLNQEGRGIGLANKMRAYALQDQGFDTVEANHRLGFEDDERDFRIGADILKQLGFSQTRLMTNNPAKVARMEASGITVTERVPLKVGETDQNAAYLATKAAKSGHLL